MFRRLALEMGVGEDRIRQIWNRENGNHQSRCPCGRLGTIFDVNTWVCARCYRIDQERLSWENRCRAQKMALQGEMLSKYTDTYAVRLTGT